MRMLHLSILQCLDPESSIPIHTSVSRHHILVIIDILLDFTTQSREYASQQAVAGERRAPGGQLVVRTTCYLVLWVGR